jgi:aminoglycoside 3-N-acetyltransferase
MANVDYTYDDLLAAYAALGVSRGGLVFVTSDLARLMRYAEPGATALLGAHLRAFRELLGAEGTLFVPTSSLDLCNTDTVFDLETTPSFQMGAFSEFVRKHEGAVRSFHPFWSVAGLGPAARPMLSDISRHAYGWNSVFQRFVEADVLGVAVGKHPRLAVPVIHHIETVAGVPYRYNKEFDHPVRRDGKVAREPFYLSVLWRDCEFVRDANRTIFEHFTATNGPMREATIGRGRSWSYSHRAFFDTTTRLLAKHPYAWLERPPEFGPWQS